MGHQAFWIFISDPIVSAICTNQKLFLLIDFDIDLRVQGHLSGKGTGALITEMKIKSHQCTYCNKEKHHIPQNWNE